uniref:non-ribosomal peptide synthetase n=1 Tax=Nocardiopsis halotolerans TaxID=124252 RepID=UPI000381FF97
MNENRILAGFDAGTLSTEDVLAFYERLEGPAERYPLSENQKGLWLLHEMAAGTDVYNVPVCFRTDEPFDTAVFRDAFERVVSRYPHLSSVVVEEEGTPYLESRFPVRVGFEHERVDGWSEDDVVSMLRDRAKEPFDLHEGPLARVHVCSAARSDTFVLLVLHHLVFDGASAPVLLSELVVTYEALRRGRRPELPVANGDYAEFARREEEFLSSSEGEEHRRYWREALDGDLPVVHLDIERRTDGPAPVVGETARLDLGTELSDRITKVCASYGTTPAVLLLAVYQLLLHRYSGVRDLVVGVPTIGGPAPDQAGAIGHFVNMVPVRQRLRPDAPFPDLLRELTLTLADGLDHAAYPFPLIARDLDLSTAPGVSPVFQVSYAFQNRSMTRVADEVMALDLAGSMRFVDTIAQEGEFKLHLEVFERDEDVALHLRYDANRFGEADVQRMLTHYRVLLEALLDAPDQEVSRHSHLSEEEHRQLDAWNDTRRDYSRDSRLDDLFRSAAVRHGDRVALQFGDRTLTYAQLDERVGEVAHELRLRGVGPDTVVGVCMERSVEMVVALWAVMRAGGAYLPVEPDLPADRIEYMLRDSGAELVLGQPHLTVPGSSAAREVLPLDDQGRWAGTAAPEGAADGDGARAVGPRDLAYVIYTSGSTGRPKGVMVEHRAAVNRIEWMQNEYGLGTDDVVLQKTPFGFDVSVWEFVWPLVTGARLVVAEPEGHKNPDYLVSLIQRTGVTTLHFVPSMFRLVVEHAGWADCTSVRRVLCSGEALPPELPARHHAVHRARLHNLYGPTEAAIDVSHWPCPDGEAPATVPIGRPIQNIRLHVLNDFGLRQAVGCVGELHIAGDGLARGYVNNPELTRERFVPDPFAGAPDARMYRTGDLARWLPDGTLEYLGRADNQVKIRGFRIEPDEIGARLAEHPAVRACAVLAREDVPGDPRLVGYVVVDGDDDRRTELLDHLRRVLPEYMVPSALVRLDDLPVTANGKLDRKALPAPEAEAHALREHVAPRTPTEHALVAACAEVLGFEPGRIGLGDDFFALGGHSLLIPKLVVRLADRGVTCDLNDVFAASSLGDLAERVDTARAEEGFTLPAARVPEGCTRVTPEMLPLVSLTEEELETVVAAVPGGAANLQDVHPLAALQEGMLFHHLKEDRYDPYVLSGAFSFADRDRMDAFVDALRSAVDRHDALRTVVLTSGLPQPLQVVLRRAELEVEPLTVTRGVPVEEQVRAVLAEPQAMPIDRAPLLRLRTAEDPDTGTLFAVLNLHHLIDDATSLGVLLREIVDHMDGGTAALDEPVPYRNFVAHTQHLARTVDSESYFRSRLGDVTESTVMFDLRDVHGDGRRVVDLRRLLDAGLGERIRDLARKLRVSPASLFHAGWALVVSSCGGRDDVVFGTVMSGRLQGPKGIERMLGNFINTLPVRVSLDGRSARDLVTEVDRDLRELARHERTSMSAAHGCSGAPRDVPLFNAILNYRHLEGEERAGEDDLERVGVRSLVGVIERSNYPVALSVDDLGDAFSVDAQIDRAQDAGLVITYLETAMEGLVSALEDEAGADRKALEIPVLGGVERRRVLEEW